MQEPRRPVYVGIDLGTTNSAVSLFDGHDVFVIRNSQGGVLTPSIVRIDARENVLVGARARRYLDTDPANTRSEFKRLMGTANQLDFPAAGICRSPEELSAEILKSLRNDIAAQTGIMPDRAVISVPALFELHQTSATSDAARLAGFERIELIQEPVASAIAAGWTSDAADGPWLVYDLGGGTFDVSLLETREGLLRIVGHDGDNFLGGRDFDRALVNLIVQKLAADKVMIDRANPLHALALRRLHFAAEEAKIELTRAGTVPIFVSDLHLGDSIQDVDVEITRVEYEAAIEPLIARSLDVCRRLLAAHGLAAGGLERVVLVGGPTVTPLLRSRVRDELGVEFGEGLDPMTLVAQGAALFAGTVGLDGRPDTPSEATAVGPKVWLQFPAVTSDLTPYVVGKLLDQGNNDGSSAATKSGASASVTAIVVKRCDGTWQSEPAPCGTDGTFAVLVNLQARQMTTFQLFGLRADGSQVAMQPASFAISHGLTLGDPPLARSIGVAMADNSVLTYFERGAPLPIRRHFTLTTVETIHPGESGYALKLPIVQGEFSQAHLCRLVGTIEIPGSALSSVLMVGSEIELMLELDRGGQLRAQGRIVSTDQIFDQVALLITAQVSLNAIEATLEKVQVRADSLTRNAFLNRDTAEATRLSGLFSKLDDVRRNVEAFRGGDLDAGEQVRRGLIEFDAILADLEVEKAWPELTQQLENDFIIALSWVSMYGNDVEKSALTKAYHACKQALNGKSEREAQMQLRLIVRLGNASYFRAPGAWRAEFEALASRCGECRDLRRATELVARGNEALRQNNQVELQKICAELLELNPVDTEKQMQGHGSGVVRR